MGGTFNTAEGGKVTVLSVQNSNARTTSLIGADQHFVAVKVRNCLGSEAGNISPAPWRVVDTDSGEYEAIDVKPAPTDFPQPTYPSDVEGDAVRPAGSCVSGWMMFGVNKDAKVSRIDYRNSHAGSASWSANLG
ncbi:hypothetical protein [Branchiibius sp. NY16-3462-2]|uniref:hypothetical protein n=1 Tax=Branchiibius sp. NY16-3462-2 TaxID=1807500 RepID=UPI0007953517|nr:hypothetical protein [Branchiibius sp. NY16-3462-2]KYH43280.1 hypothetical protein AZH51_13085 [Branchiibius sp. NY16-3462-2]